MDCSCRRCGRVAHVDAAGLGSIIRPLLLLCRNGLAPLEVAPSVGFDGCRFRGGGPPELLPADALPLFFNKLCVRCFDRAAAVAKHATARTALLRVLKLYAKVDPASLKILVSVTNGCLQVCLQANERKSILILGGSGYLGQFLVSSLAPVHKVGPRQHPCPILLA